LGFLVDEAIDDNFWWTPEVEQAHNEFASLPHSYGHYERMWGEHGECTIWAKFEAICNMHNLVESITDPPK
jgi:hypothetical protein